MSRFSIMDREWVSGRMRLVIMDWKKAEVLSLMVDECNEQDIDDELKAFIIEKQPFLKRPLWKSNKPSTL
jgi:hypothetical protein